MAHHDVADQAPQVVLRQRHDGAPENRDDGDDDDGTGELMERVLEFANVDTDDAVAAELDEQPSEDEGDGRRRLRLRVDEPGVERDDGEFDREGDEKEPGDQRRHRGREDHVMQRRDVEGPNRRLEIQDEDR